MICRGQIMRCRTPERCAWGPGQGGPQRRMGSRREHGVAAFMV